MNRRRGQGLVEFALILPVLLLIILGIIEAAFIIQGYITVQHSAREAARFAVTYQPVQGECLNDTLAPYPFCPRDYVTWPGEPDPQYHARRVALIKREARRAATGLRINDAHLGNSPQRFEQYSDEPGFFGVQVWGYPSFLTDCNDPEVRDLPAPDGCLDQPGLEGLPVQVLVRHNVEIVDPLYRAVVEYVPVQGNTQMINEGVQVGFGNLPPPAFETNPNFGVTPIPVPTDNPPPETPVVELHTYFIDLDVTQATNTLPEGRSHTFVATVTDELSRTVQGARVSFSTTAGAFSFSGVDPTYAEELTGAQGRAAVDLYGNQPGTATLRAWLDYDGDNAWQAGEPFDEATKTWTVSGPYIVVSDHEVYPGISSISIDVMDHDTARNPYSLLWCTTTGTGAPAIVRDRLNVGAGGDALDLDFQIPANYEGVFWLETHPAGSRCGASDLVARSGDIRVVVLPPDLSIASFQVPALICPSTVFTMSAVIANTSPGETDQTFDVDFFVDPVSVPPQSPVGVMKQWVSGIGPHGRAVVNTLMWVGTAGQHQIWARADSTNYVDEEGAEDNNAGAITITTGVTVGPSVDTGWLSPAANEPGPDGGFVNPGGAYADSGARASRSNFSDFTHVFRNYGFDIPDRAIIQGIEVQMDWWLDRTQRGDQLGVALSWDGGRNWTREWPDDQGSAAERSIVLGGYRERWGRNWTASQFFSDNFRVRVHAQSSGGRTFYLDWVPVRVTYGMPGECPDVQEDPPWPLPDEIKPPGLVECQQLLSVGGFEGNPETVFSYWHAGEPLAYKHQSRYFSEGSMSMRLHDSMGSYPECTAYQPYLWQSVHIPTDVTTMTRMIVRGLRLIAGSLAPCSIPDSAEADDGLFLQMRDSGGGDLGDPVEVANGGESLRTWASFEVDVTDAVDLENRGDQDVQVYFDGEHDEDYHDTWFYLDGLQCETCTGWEIPEPAPGTASIGGDVRVLVGGIPRRLQGVNVWAYSPGGEVYRTVTIQDGTYHFYNILPGTYTVYSEMWIGGGGRFATTTLTLGADERNYNVNLFLL